jgi:hypothetical protein
MQIKLCQIAYLTVMGLVLGIAPVLAASADEAGKMLTTVGDVSATQPNGVARALTAGTSVLSGDVIATGDGSAAQWRYVDGTLVSLPANSRLRIDEYLYPNPERGFFSLLKGALRTLSGTIGHKNRGDYRMTTPVATIGIRGTDYQLRLCQDDCPFGAANGLYLSVFEGAIEAANDAGEFLLQAGESAFIPDRQSSLQRKNDLPEQLFPSEPWHGGGGGGAAASSPSAIGAGGQSLLGISGVASGGLEFRATDLVRCNR